MILLAQPGKSCILPGRLLAATADYELDTRLLCEPEGYVQPFVQLRLVQIAGHDEEKKILFRFGVDEIRRVDPVPYKPVRCVQPRDIRRNKNEVGTRSIASQSLFEQI